MANSLPVILELDRAARWYVDSSAEFERLLPTVERVAALDVTAPVPMEGSLAAFSVARLLETMANDRKTGRLLLESGTSSGYVVVDEDGQICDAKVTLIEGDAPAKGLLRMLTWSTGRFLVNLALPSRVVPALCAKSMQRWLMDGMLGFDEMRRLEAEMPLTARLRSSVKPPAPADAAFCRAAVKAGSIRAVLDIDPTPDFELMGRIKKLIDDQVIAISK